jgi:hypothetical protein
MDLLYTRVAPAPDVLTRTQQHMHRTGCDNTSAYCGITNPRGAEVSARLTAGAQTARSLEDDNLLGLNGLRATLWGAVVSGLRATPRGAVVSGLRATPRGAVMSARLNGLRAALSLHSQPPAYLLQPSEACIQPPALVLHAFMQALASHAFSQLLSPACIQPPAIVRGSVA